MSKIEKVDYEAGGLLKDKLNEVIQVVNNLKCVEEEIQIYETLAPDECLIISKDGEGLLVATNRLGVVHLEKVPYPKEE